MNKTHWRSAIAETIVGITMLQMVKDDLTERGIKDGLPEIENLGDIMTFQKLAELDKVKLGETEGAWVVTEMDAGDGRCSICTYAGELTPFCPCCGAKMRDKPMMLKEFCHTVAENLGRAENE